MPKRGRKLIPRPENPNLINDDFFKKTQFTWVGKNALLEVHTQGHCGCCWASAATGAISAIDAIKRKRPAIPLSKQQLLDCMFDKYPMPEKEKELEKNECFGLSCRMAYKFAEEHGIFEEEKYHFIMARSKCKCPRDARIVKIDGAKRLDLNTVTKEVIEDYIRKQPVTCSIPLYPSFFRHRGQKIYTPTAKDIKHAEQAKKIAIDEGKSPQAHAMLIVGYGIEKNEEFYLVQNSWGKDWGYKGFAKITRSMAYNLSYPCIDE